VPTEVATDFDELDFMSARDEQGLDTPVVTVLVQLAGVAAPTDRRTRTAVLKAMRKAAEKRIEGVTENKRRRHYRHAASLALRSMRVPRPPHGWPPSATSTAGTRLCSASLPAAISISLTVVVQDNADLVLIAFCYGHVFLQGHSERIRLGVVGDSHR
jgi:hypothetical protein